MTEDRQADREAHYEQIIRGLVEAVGFWVDKAEKAEAEVARLRQNAVAEHHTLEGSPSAPCAAESSGSYPGT